MTICSLSSVFVSTSGRLPALSATSRFWMSVDSLNRPPTLFTIASSRSSSSIGLLPPRKPSNLLLQNIANVVHRQIQIFDDHAVTIVFGHRHFVPGHFQTPGQRLLALALALEQSTLELFDVARHYEDRNGVGILLQDCHRPLHVNL